MEDDSFNQSSSSLDSSLSGGRGAGGGRGTNKECFHDGLTMLEVLSILQIKNNRGDPQDNSLSAQVASLRSGYSHLRSITLLDIFDWYEEFFNSKDDGGEGEKEKGAADGGGSREFDDDEVNIEADVDVDLSTNDSNFEVDGEEETSSRGGGNDDPPPPYASFGNNMYAEAATRGYVNAANANMPSFNNSSSAGANSSFSGGFTFEKPIEVPFFSPGKAPPTSDGKKRLSGRKTRSSESKLKSKSNNNNSNDNSNYSSNYNNNSNYKNFSSSNDYSNQARFGSSSVDEAVRGIFFGRQLNFDNADNEDGSGLDEANDDIRDVNETKGRGEGGGGGGNADHLNLSSNSSVNSGSGSDDKPFAAKFPADFEFNLGSAGSPSSGKKSKLRAKMHSQRKPNSSTSSPSPTRSFYSPSKSTSNAPANDASTSSEALRSDDRPPSWWDTHSAAYRNADLSNSNLEDDTEESPTPPKRTESSDIEDEDEDYVDLGDDVADNNDVHNSGNSRKAELRGGETANAYDNSNNSFGEESANDVDFFENFDGDEEEAVVEDTEEEDDGDEEEDDEDEDESKVDPDNIVYNDDSLSDASVDESSDTTPLGSPQRAQNSETPERPTSKIPNKFGSTASSSANPFLPDWNKIDPLTGGGLFGKKAEEYVKNKNIWKTNVHKSTFDGESFSDRVNDDVDVPDVMKESLNTTRSESSFSYTQFASSSQGLGRAAPSATPPPPSVGLNQSSDSSKASYSINSRESKTTESSNSNSNSNSNKTEEKEKEVKELIAKISQFREKGRDHYSKDEYIKALENFNAALKLTPTTPPPLTPTPTPDVSSTSESSAAAAAATLWQQRMSLFGNRAATYMMLNCYQEAINDCSCAFMIDNRNIKILSRKGRAHFKIGELYHAELVFNQILKFENNPDAALGKKNVSPSDLAECKAEARDYLKLVQQHRDNFAKLKTLETKDLLGTEALSMTTIILSTATHYYDCFVYKSKALLKLKKFRELRIFLETILAESSESSRKKFAHEYAPAKAPIQAELEWKVLSQKTLHADVAASAQAILCLGSVLGSFYMIALKNLDDSRQCCGEHMDKISMTIKRLEAQLFGKEEHWMWVQDTKRVVNAMLDVKNRADNLFRASKYHEAIHFYTEALTYDHGSCIWVAMLYSNRAAAYISLKNYNSAIDDCTRSLSADSKYVKANLRRARCYKNAKKYKESVDDFNAYLSSDPTPLDAREIRLELEQTIGEKKHADIENARENMRNNQSNTGRHPSSSSSSSYSTGNKQTHQYTSQSSGAKGGGGGGKWPGDSWSYREAEEDEDEDDDDDTDERERYEHFKAYTQGKTYVPGSSYGGQSHSRPSTAPKIPQRAPPQDVPKSAYYNYQSNWGPNGPNPNRPPGGPPGGKPASSSYDRSDSRSEYKSDSRRGNTTAPAPVTKDEKDLYKLLGVNSHATERDIKVAYRKLALKFHPDKNKEEGAEDMFKSITTAYGTLTDSQTRRQYDLTRPN